MTTLYNELVKKTPKYIIHKHVSGDLSFSYEVRAPSMMDGGLWGFGIGANKMKDAEHVGELVGKHGYGKAKEIWNKEVKKKYGEFNYDFRYLPLNQKLTNELAPYAYGEYAEKIMRQMKKRK